MSYFAHTIRNHISDQIVRFCKEPSTGRKMIFMVPAMPEDTLLLIADEISSYILRYEHLSLKLKIASDLTKEWTEEGKQAADSHEWSDNRGNLTYYRSLINESHDTLMIIVLCGSDRVVDSASLDDFHTCDPETIWLEDMHQSFRAWVSEKLKSIGIFEFENDDLVCFDRIIKPILTTGRGDLLQISNWLENINLNHADDINEVQWNMLGNLKDFNLPRLSHFPLRQKRKHLSLYINKSAEFFNYTLFLEARQREKALKAIEKILNLIESGEDPNIQLDEEVLYGAYDSSEQFLQGLKNYIDTDNQTDRNKLFECDFVVIWDKVLNFKFRKNNVKKESVRKLSGSPLEVLLTSIWLTLRDYAIEHAAETEMNINSISITPDLFKHDIESGDNIKENSEQAQHYLSRLLGGIDSLIPLHLSLSNSNDSGVEFNCDLLNTDINCRYCKSAEPVLEYSITIHSSTGVVHKKFGWRLPEHHVYRLSLDLLMRAKISMAMLQDIYKLPVFHLPYYDELLQATADEEIRRVLLHSIRDERDKTNSITNLLNSAWVQEDDHLSAKLKVLAEKYDCFIRNAASNGILSAIFSPEGSWSDLRKVYGDTFETASSIPDISHSSLVGMLTRAFLLIGQKSKSLGDTWHADYYEESGVATILHPSVIEMLEAQVVYLTRCFNFACKRELSNTPNYDSFKIHIWRSYVDLSSIKAPLTGLLYNQQLNLDANVHGIELIHQIGSSNSTNTPLSTRLLLQYNDISDDENTLSDTEMFRESSESKLLLRLMQDYFDLHPHACDGLTIAVFRNKDIQPIIAAVHSFLKILAKAPTAQKPNKRYILNAQRKNLYAISVTLFTESNDETDVSTWVQQWRECWEAAETETKYDLYRRSRFSISHRIIEKHNLSSFQRLINEQFDADIAVFYNFIGAGKGVNSFEKVEQFDITSRELKFPILEKACCTIRNPAEMYRRKRVVSNRQFALGAYHANLLHSLQSGAYKSSTIVVGSGDFTPWRELIDSLHQKAEWIICVDPNMDEQLIKQPILDSSKKREIIGFGSGVGSHGEDNYTISTEQFSLEDIYLRLKIAVRSLYASEAGWSPEDCDIVAKSILNVSTQLSGLSLIRATGVGDEYIRDFMAYSLSRMLLQSPCDLLCESLISLDAYRHWFDLSDNMRRPDLMWMRVRIGQDKRLHINMHLVECKMASQSTEHINKAKAQVDNGLKVLTSSFAPLLKGNSNTVLEDDRPDRRYWWMQLHRLISSKTEVNKNEYQGVLEALERLAEGDFDISWNASVFAYWINSDSQIKRVGYWIPSSYPTVTAKVYSIGGGFVRSLILDPSFEINWAEFDNQGTEILDNDGEFIPSEIDDDYTPWVEEEDDEDNIEDPADYPSDIDKNTSGVQGAVVIENQKQLHHPTELMPLSENEIPQNLAKDDNLENTSGPEINQQVRISGEVSNSLERILLGKTCNGEQSVHWEFDHAELANRHMLIFGSSGQGKTYAIQCMLCEMTKFRQNSLIVDYTNGFLPDQLEETTKKVLMPVQHVVRQKPLPINPFLPQVSDNGGIVITENPNSIAKRIAGLFNSVYNVGDQQYSVLHRAVMDGVEKLREDMNLDEMLSIIEDMADNKKYKSSAQTLYSKFRPFILDRPFSNGENGYDWDSLFQKVDPLCNIFQLYGMDSYSGRLITEFILWDLYGHLQSRGKKTDPKVIVLDEVQNLDHKEGSPISKYLREGRKFGLSLILATQTMSNMKKDERDRMFNAAHKLFFKPADTELKSFAEIAALATRQRVDEWIRKLSSLKKGECFSIGPVLDVSGEHLATRAIKIRITALGERTFNS